MNNGAKIEDEYHKKMIERALISTGNNYRFKDMMRKITNGEETTIVYCGGSITEQKRNPIKKGYATLSYDYFNSSYSAKDNMNYVNAGMNGTSSLLGLIRVERDVLQYKPDVVFVEFAVNDAKDSVFREAFECLMIRLLQSEKKPAVVLIFMLTESGYSCQGQMQAVGEYYDLPMISVGDAILPEIVDKRMAWSDYSDDNIHPNNAGHTLIAEFIINYFKTVIEEPVNENYIVKEKPFNGNSFVNMKMLDSGNAELQSLGDFEEAITINEFKNGWIHNKNAGNNGFVMKLICKNLFVVYKENNDTLIGNAEIYVDGTLKATMSGYSIFGWDNPITKLVFQEDTAKEHIIMIKMASDDKRKEFTLLAFGYNA